jgi:hypothetical protein
VTPKINQTQIINYRRCDNYRRENVRGKKNQTLIWIIGNGTQIIGSIADNGKKQTAPEYHPSFLGGSGDPVIISVSTNRLIGASPNSRYTRFPF